MRFACLLIVLCAAFGQQPKPVFGIPAPPPQATPPPDHSAEKAELRKRIADLKVKAYEIQQQVEILEKQVKDVEDSEVAQAAVAAANSKQAPARARCGGHTKDGKRCTRMAESGGRFCWQHKVGR